MEFEKFRDILINELKGYYDEGTQFHVNRILKNNGVALQSLAILEEGENKTPNIYLDEYYLRYNMGIVTIRQLAEEIVNQRKVIMKEPMMDVKCTWEEVKDKLFCKVINKEKNKEKLSNLPHMEYLDLAVTARVLSMMDDDGIASAEVDYSMLNRLGVTEEELFAQASRNTEVLFPIKMQSLVDVVMEKMDIPPELKERIDEDNPYPMYVLSNSNGLNGATTMLYTDALNNIAEEYGVNYFHFMLSSIHECMIMLNSDDTEFMKSLVEEANRDVVGQIDYLSDSVYRYDLESDMVEIVA